MRLIDPHQIARLPWKNGAGLARDLLAWPDAGDWRLRVGIADIDADSPFSAYPGVQRWFTVLKGAGVELRIDGRVHRLMRADAPLSFDGGATTTCTLIDGPTQVLNLLLRDGAAAMRSANDGLPWQADAAQCGLFSAVAGHCRAGDQDIAVPAYTLLWFDQPPAQLSFTAGARPAALIGWWLGATPSAEPLRPPQDPPSESTEHPGPAV